MSSSMMPDTRTARALLHEIGMVVAEEHIEPVQAGSINTTFRVLQGKEPPLFLRIAPSDAEVDAALLDLATQVVADIRAEGRACVRVHLKVRFAPFFTVNRSRMLPAPTYDAAVLAATARDLLAALDDDRPVRLLGVRAEMEPPEEGY